MTSSQPRKWLVETDWLADHLDAPDVLVIDGSWHLPGAERDGHAEYLKERIPGAIFFDIDDIADETSDLPHMLPNPVKFSARMRKLGIGDGIRLVIYDSHGLFSAARVWWTFRVMGCDDVFVLNGGLKKWRAEDRPIADGPPRTRSTRHFTTRHRPAMVHDINAMIANLDVGKHQILDARPTARFAGQGKEPRAGLRPGHMPGAKNLPVSELINPDGTVKHVAELQQHLDAAGVDRTKPVVTTCGSGVTAAILSLALAETGHTNHALYDGSWTEWGGRTDVPVTTGDS